MKKIYTADRETGTFIDEFETVADAKAAIEEYEETDRENDAYEPGFYDIVDENHCSLISDRDSRQEALAGELFEMKAFGWTDEEARENEKAFFERIGHYALGLTKEEVWEVWQNVWEYEE